MLVRDVPLSIGDVLTVADLIRVWLHSTNAATIEARQLSEARTRLANQDAATLLDLLGRMEQTMTERFEKRG